MSIDDIIKPITNELLLLDKHIDGVLHSEVLLVQDAIRYVGIRPGKRLRASVMLLIGKLFGEVNDKLINYAAMIEVLHNATIIHDDVVDEATERRGIDSVNSKWNNKVSVLLGDYLFAKSFEYVYKYNDFEILSVFSKATSIMSEGELLAIQLSSTFSFSEEYYYKIIYSKTASLIEAACRTVAMIYTDDAVIVDAITNYGRNIGMGFQIRDDLFDYTSDNATIGKPVGNDIKEKQITLPLIYTYDNANESIKAQIDNILHKTLIEDRDIQQLVQLVVSSGGIEYAQAKATYYSNEAIRHLVELSQKVHFSEEIVEKLIDFAKYMVYRIK